MTNEPPFVLLYAIGIISSGVGIMFFFFGIADVIRAYATYLDVTEDSTETNDD